MSFGMLFRNADGALVVDSTFLNYALIDSGAFVQSVGTSISSVVRSFPGAVTSLNPPLIAATWAANNTVYCWGVQMVGSPGAWTGFKLHMQAIPAAGNVTISYAAYVANPTSVGGFGVQVKAADGAISFDSSFTPLEIAGFLPPTGWTNIGNELPGTAYRVMTYSRPNPVAGSTMVLSTHRYGDLVYPNGNEGEAPVALAGYGYGYGTGGTLRMIITLDTAGNTTPSSLSTPNSYVSALAFTGF